MDQHKANSLIYRISSGKQLINFAGTTYTVVQPSFDLQHQATNIYNDVVYRHRFNNWTSQEQCISRLIQTGILAANHQAQLKELNDNLENNKLNLYRSFFNEKKQAKIRSYINLINNKLLDIHNTLVSLEYLTLHGFAAICKQEFILTQTIYLPDGNLAFGDNPSFALLKSLLEMIDGGTISIVDYRSLARHHLWRDIWRTSKNNVFPGFTYYTDEQKSLFNLSKMYDMVYESPEAPVEEIIEDNDALDGWFIEKRLEIEEHKKEKRADKFSSKHHDAEELFIVADTEKDRQRINEMNTGQSKMIKHQRAQTIQKHGKVTDSKLPDRQMKNRQLANQAYMARVKGNK